MLLASLTALVTMVAPGSSCAVIDNTANIAAFTDRAQQVHVTSYRDRDRLVYAVAPSPTDNPAWRALHAAERSIQSGDPGPKIRYACRR